MMTDQEKFLKENADAIRVPEVEGLTTVAFMTKNFLWLFAKTDGHLAWKYDMTEKRVLYECNCIKRGREMLFGRR